jgi:CBS-domain-containing membrane protein
MGATLRSLGAGAIAVAVGTFALGVLKFAPPWSIVIGVLTAGMVMEVAYWSRRKPN